MASTKVHYTLDDEAIAIVNRLAESPNKRGEWVSNTIMDYARITGSMAATPSGDDAGVLETIVAKLERIEKQMVVIMQKIDA